VALHGVVDLAGFLGLRQRPLALALRDQARLLALNPGTGSHCALLVDRLAGLRNADQLPDRGACADQFQPTAARPRWPPPARRRRSRSGWPSRCRRPCWAAPRPSPK
jgi:hypothetical protein